jgi:hypothetical protein
MESFKETVFISDYKYAKFVFQQSLNYYAVVFILN